MESDPDGIYGSLPRLRKSTGDFMRKRYTQLPVYTPSIFYMKSAVRVIQTNRGLLLDENYN